MSLLSGIAAAKMEHCSMCTVIAPGCVHEVGAASALPHMALALPAHPDCAQALHCMGWSVSDMQDGHAGPEPQVHWAHLL